jgi:hypothetical protein
MSFSNSDRPQVRDTVERSSLCHAGSLETRSDSRPTTKPAAVGLLVQIMERSGSGGAGSLRSRRARFRQRQRRRGCTCGTQEHRWKRGVTSSRGREHPTRPSGPRQIQSLAPRVSLRHDLQRDAAPAPSLCHATRIHGSPWRFSDAMRGRRLDQCRPPCGAPCRRRSRGGCCSPCGARLPRPPAPACRPPPLPSALRPLWCGPGTHLHRRRRRDLPAVARPRRARRTA